MPLKKGAHASDRDDSVARVREAKTGEDGADPLDLTKHLSSIDKLLTAAFEMIQRGPAFDRAAFEQLRQVRMRVRRALATTQPLDPDSVPTTAPALFRNRHDPNEGPISFLSRTYAPWIGKNLLRSDLKRLDPNLYNSIYNLDNPSQQLAAIGFATKKQLNDRAIDKAVLVRRPPKRSKPDDLAPEAREAARMFYLLRSRKQRRSKQK